MINAGRFLNDCVSGSPCFSQVPLNMAALTSSSSMGGLDYETFVWDHRIYRYMFLSGFVILVYDHLLSFGSEVKLMWCRKLRPSIIWFFALRYISLGCSCAIFAFYFGNLSMESCSKMEKVLEALLMLQESLVETTLALRVFAMYGFKLWVAIPMGLAANLAAALGIWTIVKYGNPRMLSAPGMNGCHTAIPRSTALRLAGAWEAQLLLDTLVFGLTLYRAHADRAVMTMVPGSLIERMMRDGAMYFGIIVLASLANVVTLYLGDIMIAGILSWWTTSLSVTLISRLILNVHRTGVGNAQTAEFDTTEIEGIHFVDDAPRARPQLRSVDDMGSLFDDV
ncbi:hypothetical protein DFH06DRAFT_1197785 [Mycena polygramma]|nr:hypothetical protein DFH06DRAFT_1197785 [Mycena polygramma]